MKDLWCWRCRMLVPMLDEGEYSKAAELFRQGFDKNRTTEKSFKERFTAVCDYYTQLTGLEETNANAVMHHRISLYGPPCEECGKPYRTPEARFCAACGHKRVPV